MIKFKKVSPIAVIKSTDEFTFGRIKTVNDMKKEFDRKFYSPLKEDRLYKVAYHIEKVSVKKEVVNRKPRSAKNTASRDGKHRMKVIRNKCIIMRVYRFKIENIAEFKQHSRHFTVTLKV